MVLATIEDDHFKICGENGKGGIYSNKNVDEYEYEIKLNKNGKLCIVDLNYKKEYEIITLENLDILSDEDEIFDPAKITELFDPSTFYSDEDSVFSFEQVFFPSMGKTPNTIVRFIEKIDFITVHRFCEHKKIISCSLENITENERKKYHLNDIIYFTLTNEKREVFLSELNKSKVFDHNWLSQFIPEYFENCYLNA